jgi:cellobiose transport system substrate-binding protein
MSSKKWLITQIVAIASAGILALGVVTPAKASPTPVTLNFWYFGNVLEPKLVKMYNALHPEVKIQPKQMDLDALNGQSAIAACQGVGIAADIMAIEISYSGYWRQKPQCFTDLRTLKTSGQTVAIKRTNGVAQLSGTSYLTQDCPATYDRTTTFDCIPADESANTLKSDYLDWRWANGVGNNGAVFGIPTDVGGLQVAYRTDLFKKAGLPTDRTKVSALWPTWDKFIATGATYVKTLSAADRKKNKSFMDNIGTIYSAILNQGTQKYYSNPTTKDPNGKVVVATNPQVKTAFDTTLKASTAGIGSKVGQFSADWGVGMSNGAFATILAPAWMMDYIKQLSPDTMGKWDIATIPGGGGNMGGSQLTIPVGSKNKQAAWDFISWYLAPAQQLTTFKTYGLFPSAKNIYDDASIQGYTDPFFSGAPIGKIYATGATKLKPIFEGMRQRCIDQAMGSAISLVANAKKDPKGKPYTSATAFPKGLKDAALCENQ